MAMSACTAGSSRVRDMHTGREFSVDHPVSDIDSCIAFSYSRCLLSLFSLLLVMTDIPRTGTSVSLFRYYPKVGPGIAMYYGPYAYPIVHMNRTDAGQVSGFVEGDPISSVDFWPYKFDSLSIPLRAMAEHLNISTWSPCVMYDDSRCPPDLASLSVDTAFVMLDGWISAVHNRYFDSPTDRKRPVLLKTLSWWADRLHHVLFGRYTHRTNTRVHSFHGYTVSSSNGSQELSICAHAVVDRIARPMICDLAVPWTVDHSTDSASTQVLIADSISMRVAVLQSQYPGTDIDVVLTNTQSLQQTARKRTPWEVYFSSENIEATTFMRVKKCDSHSGKCRTIAVDDYRYERATIETPSDEVSVVLASLRVISQGYVWLRCLLLLHISVQARLAEPRCQSMSWRGKLCIVTWTILHIPSHVVIYGSWVPLLGYSIAYLGDCAVVHMISENFWATPNGFFSFDFVRYVVLASIQMRNIWVIALLWKCLVALYARLVTHRRRPWHPTDGVFTLRTLFISTVSFLTIFALLRAISFRNSKVLSIAELPRNNGVTGFSACHEMGTRSEFGVSLDAKVTVIAVLIVLVVLGSAQHVIRVLGHHPTQLFTCQSYYVPASAGVLFPLSAMSVFWSIRLIPQRQAPQWKAISALITLRRMSTRLLSSVMPAPPNNTKNKTCDVCTFRSTPIHWRPTQGCVRHERLQAWGHQRPVEVQSMVRLINMAMLSDPIAYFQVQVIGKPLYLFQTTSLNRTSTWATKQTRGPHASSMQNADAFRLVLSPRRAAWDGSELIGIVDSSTVPWSLLVDCG